MTFQAFAYLDVNNPVVAWNVYRGILISSQASCTPPECPVSMMFASIVRAQNNIRFYNELIIDSVRALYFPHQISRLSGMYFFTDKSHAEEAISWGSHFCPENLAELEIKPIGSITRVDSSWITHAKLRQDGSLDETDLSWITNYWAGKPYGDSPIWETIAHGRAEVLDLELRRRTYHVISNAFPNALDMLEVARLACAVGSDLGQATAWITRKSADIYELLYYLDMRDAENPEALKRLSKYKGPRNIRDIAPGKETFGLPVFLPYVCQFNLSRQLNSPTTSIHHQSTQL